MRVGVRYADIYINYSFSSMQPYQKESYLAAHIIYCPKCKSNNQHYTYELCGRNKMGRISATSLIKHECTMCGMESYDYFDKDSETGAYDLYRILPLALPANLPFPSPDLPESCLSIYVEATHVFNYSPRASAALLRLCLQQLLQHLGFHGAINEMIKQAVQKGVPEHIQQFMDITRHHGNAAAHGGDLALNPDENRDNTEYLFTVINTLAECLITRPREAKEAYNKLPESIRQQIARRDK